MAPILRSRTSKNPTIILLDSSFTSGEIESKHTHRSDSETEDEANSSDHKVSEGSTSDNSDNEDSFVDTVNNSFKDEENPIYSENRLKNIQANKALLKSFDIGCVSKVLPKRPIKRSLSVKPPSTLRRSSRLSHSDPDYNPTSSDLEDDENHIRRTKRKTSKSMGEENKNSRKGYSIQHCPSMQSFRNLPYVEWKQGPTFGTIPGVPVGSLFPYRIDCSKAGVHRPTVAGIHGHSKNGCYSICVSNGYPEDIDTGDRIVFSGSGGRSLRGTKENPKNLRTAPQDHDMELNNSNESLISSYNNGNAIRVVRGPKSHFSHPPVDCYRYDGLYQCTSYSYEKGESGFFVYLFTLERLPNQPELTSLPVSLADPKFESIQAEILNYRQNISNEVVSDSNSSSPSPNGTIASALSPNIVYSISSDTTSVNPSSASPAISTVFVSASDSSTSVYSPSVLSSDSTTSIARSNFSKTSSSSLSSTCVYPASPSQKKITLKSNAKSNTSTSSSGSRVSVSDPSSFPKKIMGFRVTLPFETTTPLSESLSPQDPPSTPFSLSKYLQEPSFSTISTNTENALNEIFHFSTTASDTSIETCAKASDRSLTDLDPKIENIGVPVAAETTM